MFEVVSNYQRKSGLVGPTRTKVLQKALAAAIAYSAPCFAGEFTEGGAFYNSTVMSNAMKIVSEVNELCLVNADDVMADVRLIWMGRYDMINYPIGSNNIDKFLESLSSFGEDVKPHYQIWLEHFYKATKTKWVQLNGGV